MRQTRTVPTTMAIASDLQPDPMPTSVTTMPLSAPWWRPAALLPVLRPWVTSWTGPHAAERRDLRPDFPRQETPIDILARKHTFLYACSMSG
jgi:hypothetical protein